MIIPPFVTASVFYQRITAASVDGHSRVQTESVIDQCRADEPRASSHDACRRAATVLSLPAPPSLPSPAAPLHVRSETSQCHPPLRGQSAHSPPPSLCQASLLTLTSGPVQVRSLTLRADKQTSHRRVPAAPQLKCISPRSICALHTVDTMQCVNRGGSYSDEDIQWSCSASLPPELKLGSTDVVCEGYASADDAYVLRGSCGVEYRLVLTEEGQRRFPDLGAEEGWWGGLGEGPAGARGCSRSSSLPLPRGSSTASSRLLARRRCAGEPRAGRGMAGVEAEDGALEAAAAAAVEDGTTRRPRIPARRRPPRVVRAGSPVSGADWQEALRLATGPAAEAATMRTTGATATATATAVEAPGVPGAAAAAADPRARGPRAPAPVLSRARGTKVPGSVPRAGVKSPVGRYPSSKNKIKCFDTWCAHRRTLFAIVQATRSMSPVVGVLPSLYPVTALNAVRPSLLGPTRARECLLPGSGFLLSSTHVQVHGIQKKGFQAGPLSIILVPPMTQTGKYNRGAVPDISRPDLARSNDVVIIVFGR